MSLENAILEFLQTYNNESFYVGSSISQKRLQSAHKSHGVDPRDKVWAVIDSTILGGTSGGSADNGMSIASSGIYWKNMWAVKTRLNQYSWEELTRLVSQAEVGGGNIKFSPGVEFYAPATFKADHILNMLRAIVKLYSEYTGSTSAIGHSGEVNGANSTNMLQFSQSDQAYADSLGRYLAVVTCHAGTADEACVALAVELLEEEEVAHPGVLATFAETIEGLEREHQRSLTFFKLKQARVLSEVKQLPENDEERIRIMCEALAEATRTPTGADALRKVDEILRR